LSFELKFYTVQNPAAFFFFSVAKKITPLGASANSKLSTQNSKLRSKAEPFKIQN